MTEKVNNVKRKVTRLKRQTLLICIENERNFREGGENDEKKGIIT